jgi:hypothetical protein
LEADVRRAGSLLLTALGLLACAESSPPACATQISQEVCSTPAQLRGAQPVQASASEQADLTPSTAALAEGRYVLIARSTSCPVDADTFPPPALGVLELSGCVLRRTLVSEGQEASVEVFELSDAAQGSLALQRRCPAADDGALTAGYSFDGERLVLDPLRGGAAATDGAGCEIRDTWELR